MSLYVSGCLLVDSNACRQSLGKNAAAATLYTEPDYSTYLIQQKSTTTTTILQPFNGLWSGTTRVGRYQKKQLL